MTDKRGKKQHTGKSSKRLKSPVNTGKRSRKSSKCQPQLLKVIQIYLKGKKKGSRIKKPNRES